MLVNEVELSIKLFSNNKDKMEVCSKGDIENIFEWDFSIYIIFTELGCKKIQKIAKENIGKSFHFYVNSELIFTYLIYPPALEEVFGTITTDNKCICVYLAGEKIDYLKKCKLLTINKNILEKVIVINKDTKVECYEDYLQTIVNFCELLISNNNEYKKYFFKNKQERKGTIEVEFEQLFDDGYKVNNIEIFAVYPAYSNNVFWTEINYEFELNNKREILLYHITIEKINEKFVIY
jgi:hypothetical protein